MNANIGKLLSATISGFLLSSCGGAHVEIPAQFPTPVVNTAPLHIGIYIKPELNQFIYNETIKGYGKWTIRLGPAQKEMFTVLSNGMFENAELVSSAEFDRNNVHDAILIPDIIDIQFSIPKQTRSDFFEVWIKYRMILMGPDNNLIAEWDLPAYGTANQKNYSNLQGNNPALQQAALNACRDAMAFFAIQFQNIPEIKHWLDNR